MKLGVLSEEDYRAVRAAYRHFCFKELRNELHFRREEKPRYVAGPLAMQMSIAESWGYEGTGTKLPVEQFMQDCLASRTKHRDTRPKYSS